MKWSMLRLTFAACAALSIAPSAAAQWELQKLAPIGLQAQDGFGWSVSATADALLIGAVGDDTTGANAGAVYAFAPQPSGWVFTQKVTHVDAGSGSQFGNSSAVRGDTALITAHINGPGKVYHFQRSGGVWIYVETLTASDGQHMFHFGHHIALDANGTTAVIGQMADNWAGVNSGSAYVFELVGGSFVEVFKLKGSDTAANDRFGRTVAISGDRILVGADRHNANTGKAYVFRRDDQGTPGDPTDDTWPEMAKLAASDGVAGDQFGLGVAIDGSRALVGAVEDVVGATKTGSAYVFEEAGGLWTEVQKLLASDAKLNDSFGAVVRLSGDLALIGARDCDEGASATGAVYVFARKASGFLQSAKIVASDAGSTWILGDEDSVALVGNEVISAAWSASSASGAAYVHAIAPDALLYCSCASAAPCGNLDAFGGCANSTGQGGVLYARGSSSIAQDDFGLQARWLPADKPAIFFMGGLANQAPFADGQLCLAAGTAGIYRYSPALTTGPNGVMSLGPGVAGLSLAFPPSGQIASGQAWHFQAWFRDPSGPCGQGSNLTNAVRMLFTP